MKDDEVRWMVIRPASYAPYWAQPATFGPMTKEEAQNMIAGGFMMTVEEFTKAGYR